MFSVIFMLLNEYTFYFWTLGKMTNDTVIIFDFYICHSVKIISIYLHYVFPRCTVNVICGAKGLSTRKAWVRLFVGPGTLHSLHSLQHHIEFSAIGAPNYTDSRKIKEWLSSAGLQHRSRPLAKEPVVGAYKIYLYIHFTTSLCLWELYRFFGTHTVI